MYEGWSTTIEEARAYNINMLISDIDVNREQNCKKAKYFKEGLNKEKVVNAIKGKSIVYNFAGISDIGDAMINPIKIIG